MKLCWLYHNTGTDAGVYMTHWTQEKMAVILQAAFSKAFSCVKIAVFRLQFHRNFLIEVKFTVISIGEDNGLVLNGLQAIIWTNDCVVYWRIHTYASIGLGGSLANYISVKISSTASCVAVPLKCREVKCTSMMCKGFCIRASNSAAQPIWYAKIRNLCLCHICSYINFW